MITYKPAQLFERAETGFFLGLGALLMLAALVAFGQALYLMFTDVDHGTTNIGLIAVLDRVLLVLMIIELLHTVRISIQSREIRCQPFLIIGLIAAIRRVLVVTLQSSEISTTHGWSPASQGMFMESTVELVVLSLLIATMVGATSMLKRADIT
ncbi:MULTISPECIES: phosphate-starvation-inducible PsiE family protein [Acidiphilium]|uniref:Phosphate-starvation-inducible E n=1 Tax=Acidiphilium rubrum TaxID=526 RepID=A0A8G2CP17_ACIRU|nr:MULTISPECIES: phosphate-starvation-inducible PsiE family protein [Acidiphilium]MCW8308717.1 phosphate-starvation-inducible PsiE family protein [Acidiphilium sp. PA]SIR54145.1 Phosphate-starvation-inducible E [Acidiphilium rubrum]